MKLTKIFTEAELLTESIRFGNREIKMVKSFASEIKLGVEYEYNVYDDAADNDGGFEDSDSVNDARSDAIFERAQELMEKDIEQKKEEATDGYADNDMEQYNVESGTASLDALKKMYGGNASGFDKIADIEDEFQSIMTTYDGRDGEISSDDQKVITEYISLLKFHNDNLNRMHNEIQSLEYDEQLERWVSYIGDNDIAETLEDAKIEMDEMVVWSDNLKAISPTDHDAIEVVFSGDYFEFGSSTLQDWLSMVADMSGGDSRWEQSILDEFKEQFEDHWESEKEVYLGYDPENVYETEFWEIAEEEIHGSGDFNISDKVAWIDGQLQNSANDWDINYRDIEDVKEDPSVPEGVETVTNPLKMNDAFDLMEKMFDHISDIGSTADNTGMHINLSIRGLHYKRDNFNVTKLLLLMDPKMLKEFFGLRGYVSDQFEGLTSNRLFSIAGSSNTSAFITQFEELAFKNVKHQQINFTNFTDIGSTGRGDRIEFRYVGGDGYEKRFNTIQWNIYRLTFMTMAAFSEGFGHKEYLKAIVKVLDEETQDQLNMSFKELAKWRKDNKGKNNNYEYFRAYHNVDGSSDKRDLNRRINLR